LFAGAQASADEVIRIMAANTTSGNNASYNPGEGNRIFRGLTPDIALVQEMNVGVVPNKNTAATYRAWVTANFGSSFSYHVEAGSGGDIPNGIVSRYPILASGEWNDSFQDNRDHVWAKIDIPGDVDLWAVSVHLSSSAGATERNQQAAQLVAFIRTNVPVADYLVIGGDLNTDNRNEACLSTLSAAAPPFPSTVITAGPYPVDQAFIGHTNKSRAKPYDWVLVDADLHARRTPLVIGSNTFPNGLVFDSRVYTPLSQVAPVLLNDSGAIGMQHMAVVRAFRIPINDPPVIASAANSSSTEIVVDPDTSVYEIVRGTTVGLTVSATDDGGEPALKYTWDKTSSSGGTVNFSVNANNAAKFTTASFPAIGDYTLTATVQDLSGLNITSSIKVRVVATATTLAVSPSTTDLTVDQTRAFAATLRDQFSQIMAGSITWAANGGGSIDPIGLFTATSAGGPFSITASCSSLSSSSSVIVTRAPATVSLTHLSQTYDGSPKPVTATTLPAGLSVTLLYDGSPTPPIFAGSYSVTATITDSDYQGSATETLLIAPDAWALWKNSYFTRDEQDAGFAADPEDPDFDGLPNLIEYALGSHPLQTTPSLPPIIDSAGFSITFTRPASLPGIRYLAEVSSDLITWELLPLQILVPGPFETLQALDPVPVNSPPARFLRLRIERE